MAQNTKTKASDKPDTPKVRVRYDNVSVEFGSQFMINAHGDEIVINVSPGFIVDPQTSERMMPIQTRIAMTRSGAARLVNVLSAALKGPQSETPSEQTTADEAAADEPSH